jgi:hypothetical protein
MGDPIQSSDTSRPEKISNNMLQNNEPQILLLGEPASPILSLVNSFKIIWVEEIELEVMDHL